MNLPVLIYRAIIGLYPSGFRNEYGDEAIRLFRTLHHDRRRQGIGAAAAFTARMRLQATAAALAEWKELYVSGEMHLLPERRTTMGRWSHDFRNAVRAFRKGPGFAFTVVLLLAAGIGATTTVFSVVDGVLLRQLPYPDPDALIHVGEPSHPPSTFQDWEAQVQSVSTWAAVWTKNTDLTADGPPLSARVAWVTPRFFEVLGARPALGRFFAKDEFRPAPEAIVLSYGIWQSRWGGDPDIVGRQIRMDDGQHTVIGVMSSEFDIPDVMSRGAIHVWAPLDVTAPVIQDRGLHVLEVVGRLKNGATLDQAQADMDRVSAGLAERFPDHYADADGRVRVFPLNTLHEASVGRIRPALLMLLGAVTMLMLIACANVANLLLARGTDRAREFALRGALGASRRNILAQLTAESLLLSISAGVVGSVIAYGGVRTFMHLLPSAMPRAGSVTVDGRVLLFALAVSILTGLIFGIVPAMRAMRVDAGGVLKEASTQSTAGRQRAGLQSMLVVGELALSLVLLTGAGLLFHSFLKLTSVEIGFDPTELVTVDLRLGDRYTPETRPAFIEGVFERVRQIPGTRAVVAGVTLPFQYGRGGTCCWRTDFRSPAASTPVTRAFVHPVMRGFFASLGVPIIAGRELTAGDERMDPVPMVINEAMAQEVFRGPDRAVGQPLYLEDDIGIVVGVSRNVHYWQFDRDVEREVYVPQARYGAAFAFLNIAVRTDAPVQTTVAAMRKAIWEIDPNLPLGEFRSMEDRMNASVADERFYSMLLGTFAVVALLLTAGGVYATFLYAVRRREREMGIRMALGARSADIVGLVMRRGLVLIFIGLVLGVAGAVAAGRSLEGMIFGITARDPMTLITVSGLLAVVALAACFVPALRAGRTNPMEVLRRE